jgi:hypothetical protein
VAERARPSDDFTLLEEVWQEALALARRLGWEPEELVTRALERGLALAEGADLMLLPGDGPAADAVNDAARQLAAAEAERWVMRQHAVRLWREQATLEAELRALTAENLALRQEIAAARRAEEALKAERARLQAALGRTAG